MTIEQWMELFNKEKARADSLEMDVIGLTHRIRELETELNLYKHREVIDGVVDSLFAGKPQNINR